MIPRVWAIDVANQESLQRTHEWFNRSDPTIFITMATLFGLMLLSLVLAAMWQRLQDLRLEPAARQPMVLFRHLLRRLGLARRDRWMLSRLARRLALPHPAALLISEEFFAQALAHPQAKSLSEGSAAERFRGIRAILFGHPVAP